MQTERPVDEKGSAGNAMTAASQRAADSQEIDARVTDKEEQRKIRRLQLRMEIVMSVLRQDVRLTVDEAAELVAESKKAALAMFPDKELAYNLIYKPRIQRLMRERFRIQ